MREHESARASRVTSPVSLRFRVHRDAAGEPSSVFGQDLAHVCVQRNVGPRGPAIQRTACDEQAVCVARSPVAYDRETVDISDPGDAGEREAEDVADRIVSDWTQPPVTPRASTGMPRRVQRLSARLSPAPEDAEFGEQEPSSPGQPRLVQRLKGASRRDCNTTTVAGWSGWMKSLSAPTSAGQPLDRTIRGDMEARFGADFSRVRVHTDPRAGQLASSIGALAFTYGSDIYFGAGAFAPTTAQGRRILAHELTHTLQQGAASRASSEGNSAVAEDTRHTPIQRMADLDYSKKLQESVYPWGKGGPSGTNYSAQTDAGTNVRAWVAYSPWRIELHYWCHGHSLGTFERFGYSVYSGAPMAQVIADEWQSVPPANTRPGDLAVFSNYGHSARFVTPVVTGGALDESASILSTKNGQAAVKNDTLSSIRATYSELPSYGVFRHR